MLKLTDSADGSSCLGHQIWPKALIVMLNLERFAESSYFSKRFAKSSYFFKKLQNQASFSSSHRGLKITGQIKSISEHFNIGLI
jgi:hypothetical protein